MTIKEYQKRASETDIYPQDHLNRLSALSLGLVSEASELKKKYQDIILGKEVLNLEIAHEIVDCVWYASRLAEKLSTSLYDIYHDRDLIPEGYLYKVDLFGNLIDNENTEKLGKLLIKGYVIDDLIISVGEVGGIVKKHIRGDKKPLDKIIPELKKTILICEHLLELHGFTLENGLKLNIEKLQKRKEKGTIKGDGDNR